MESFKRWKFPDFCSPTGDTGWQTDGGEVTGLLTPCTQSGLSTHLVYGIQVGWRSLRSPLLSINRPWIPNDRPLLMPCHVTDKRRRGRIQVCWTIWNTMQPPLCFFLLTLTSTVHTKLSSITPPKTAANGIWCMISIPDLASFPKAPLNIWMEASVE